MQLLLQVYGWEKLLTLELLVVAVGAALLYAKAGNEEYTSNNQLQPLPMKRQAAFYAGLLVMYLAYGGVLAVLAKESIDYYVIQMGLRYMMMVPLLVSGLDRTVRTALIRKLPWGNRWLCNWCGGPGAAMIFFCLLSLMLFAPVHNLLAEMIWLRLLLQALLLISSWLMWEGILRRSAHDRSQSALALSVLGCVMLFPICVTMLLSGSGAYWHAHILDMDMCGPPDAHAQLLRYWTDSTSNYGGLLLLGIQQLAFGVVVRGSKPTAVTYTDDASRKKEIRP